MDKSKLATPGTTITYKPFDFETGRSKLSRKVEQAVCPCCGMEEFCGCDHQVTSQPLAGENPCGGGKIK